jgi:hypothetical protein
MSIGNPFKPDRLKGPAELEAENAKLRKIVANLAAHVQLLKAGRDRPLSARTGVPAKNSAHDLH